MIFIGDPSFWQLLKIQVIVYFMTLVLVSIAALIFDLFRNDTPVFNFLLGVVIISISETVTLYYSLKMRKGVSL